MLASPARRVPQRKRPRLNHFAHPHLALHFPTVALRPPLWVPAEKPEHVAATSASQRRGFVLAVGSRFLACFFRAFARTDLRRKGPAGAHQTAHASHAMPAEGQASIVVGLALSRCQTLLRLQSRPIDRERLFITDACAPIARLASKLVHVARRESGTTLARGRTVSHSLQSMHGVPARVRSLSDASMAMSCFHAHLLRMILLLLARLLMCFPSSCATLLPVSSATSCFLCDAGLR